MQLRFFLSFFLVLGGLASAAEPGLVAVFGDDARVQARAALFVPVGKSASTFSEAGPFAAELSGLLRLEKRSRLYFSFAGRGSVKLFVDGELALEDAGPVLGSVESERLRINSGDVPVRVEYESPAEGASELRALWRGRDFATETIPASVLFHDPANAPKVLAASSQKRVRAELVNRKQCLVCHGDAAPQAPTRQSLEKLLDPYHVWDWIVKPERDCSTAVDDQGAQDIAQWLEDAARVELPEPPEALGGGLTLATNLNLMTWRKELDRVRFRSLAAVATFLKTPGQLEAEFPVFELTDAERWNVAKWAYESGPMIKRRPLAGDAKRGALLFAKNCASCHDANANKQDSAPPWLSLDWAKGCLSRDDRGKAPELLLTPAERAALQAGKAEVAPILHPEERVHGLMKRIRCDACHNQDTVMPSIDWAGEKFQSEWLHKLFAGKHAAKSRPWLKTRMPAFPELAETFTRGLAVEAGFNPDTPEPVRLAKAPDLEIGKKLLFLDGGYACISCHGVGDKPPVAVFEGQGPALQISRDRLRHDFFMRWMIDPQRMMPQTIMPKFVDDEGKAVLGDVMDGDPHRQFGAIWDYLQTFR